MKIVKEFILRDIAGECVLVPTGETTNFFGIETDKCIVEKVKTRVCPKCGKVEMYIDTTKFDK